MAFERRGIAEGRERPTRQPAFLRRNSLGQEVGRPGLLIDRLVGIACEGINLGPLNTLVPDLDARTCKELASRLERMDANREALQATWDQERNWALRSGGTLERVKNRMVLLVSRGNLQTIRQKTAPKFAQIQFQERDLMLHLAAQAYQLDHGKTPGRPGDLVPEYLEMIPKDPVTGKELTLK